MNEEDILIPPLRLADETLYEERRRNDDNRLQNLEEYREAQHHVNQAIAAYLSYKRTCKWRQHSLVKYERYFRRLYRVMPAPAALDVDR